ncbi:hypothetical protein AgCh_024940 [Apium graveolens]
METISIIDVLRRAKAEVIDASVEDAKETIGSRKVKIVADMLLNEASKLSYDLIALPGGIPGAKKFTSSETLVEMLKKQKFSKKSCGAICASPALVLEPHGLLESPVDDVELFRLSGAFPTFMKDGKTVAFVDSEFKSVCVANDQNMRKVYDWWLVWSAPRPAARRAPPATPVRQAPPPAPASSGGGGSMLGGLGTTIDQGMGGELLISFRRATGQKSQRIIFYRDGVNEGQFNQVLLYELDAICIYL